eukprot:gene25753-32242_t
MLGWMVQYGDWTGTSVTRYSMGLAAMTSFRPTTFLVTSSKDGSVQSILWRGVYGSLEVTKVVHFRFDELFVTTSVVVRNIGTQAITNFYYARTADPDQDAAQFNSFKTENYVQYQQTPAKYTHPNNAYTALVCGLSHYNYNVYVSLGAVHPYALVSSANFVVTDPAGNIQNLDWQGY